MAPALKPFTKSALTSAFQTLRLSAANIERVEMYWQDHCCGGPKVLVRELAPEEFSGLVAGMRDYDEIVKFGCKCDTAGIQLAIHLKGSPSYAQLTFVGCGYFVLHDGRGKKFGTFRSKGLSNFLKRVYPYDRESLRDQPKATEGTLPGRSP